MKTFINLVREQLLDFHHNIAVDILTFKNLFTYQAIIPLMLSSLVAVKFSNLLIFFFFIFYLLDFITGIFATRVEIKKDPRKYETLRERKGRAYWIESERIVRGIVKMIVYIQLIILAGLATLLFEDKYFKIHESLIPISIFQLMLVLCITAEFVSNLENSKRAGFDVIDLVSKGIKNIWSITKLIKTGKDE